MAMGKINQVVFHPSAVEEIEAAIRWYRQRDMRVAERLLEQIEYAVGAIRQQPDVWPAYSYGTSRYLLRGFPFLVVYRCVRTKVQVIALAHTSRRPGYWRDRS